MTKDELEKIARERYWRVDLRAAFVDGVNFLQIKNRGDQWRPEPLTQKDVKQARIEGIKMGFRAAQEFPEGSDYGLGCIPSYKYETVSEFLATLSEGKKDE